jgi:hypothetical protein
LKSHKLMAGLTASALKIISGRLWAIVFSPPKISRATGVQSAVVKRVRQKWRMWPASAAKPSTEQLRHQHQHQSESCNNTKLYNLMGEQKRSSPFHLSLFLYTVSSKHNSIKFKRGDGERVPLLLLFSSLLCLKQWKYKIVHV